MEVCKLATIKDVEFCADMYLALNDDSFLPTDRRTSIASLHRLARGGKFVRALKKDGLIVAWIYADLVHLSHSDLTFFQQLYYASAETGLAAYRCLVQLHEEMYAHARTTKADYCLSACSPMDTTQVLARALEKNGWKRRGFLAAKVVVPAPPGQARLVGRLDGLEGAATTPLGPP